jgi:hypothetical protein
MSSSPIIQVQPGGPVSITETRRSIEQMVEQRSAIVEAMRKVMKVDIDYGTIPGTPKPTLYKPGSEKILSMFHLAATPRVEDVSTPDCIRYRVFVDVTHAPTGSFLGTGIGEASSAETKYQWRAIVCDEEWNETPEDRRRAKWKKGRWNDRQRVYDPAEAIRQVRTEMDDVANTILKMAKKRAQIDATLTVTAASDIFSQDLEDLKDAGLDPQVGEVQPSQASSDAQPELQKKASSSPAAAQTAPVQNGAACISEGEAKRFWAVAMGRTNDYKQIMEYLKAVHGVTKKDLIIRARLAEAMVWAETGRVDD